MLGAPSSRSQVLSCLAVLVVAASQGMSMGWPSPAIPRLSEPGWGPFVPTLDEASWIVSCFDLGLLLGVLASAAVFSRTGRRPTLLIGPVSYALCVVLTTLARAPWQLMLARLLSGTGHGVLALFVPIYLGEVLTPRLRGPVIAASSLICPAGQLLSMVLGPRVPYWALGVLPLPTVLLSLVFGVLWMRESPYHLAARGREPDMRATLRCLRRGEPVEAVLAEGDAILRDARRQREDVQSWRETFSQPGSKRAACIVLLLSGSSALAGVLTVFAFTQQIFIESGSPIDAATSAIAVISVKVLLVFVAMFLLGVLGRRVHYGSATLLNGVATLCLAVFFLAKEQLGLDVESVQWVPLASLVLFVLATGLGVLVVPQVLMSELLDERAKAIVAPCSGVLLSATSFAIQKNFLIVGNNVGFAVPFAFFTLANFLLSAFTFLMVPETRGKTLVEVQEMLRRRRKSPAYVEFPSKQPTR